MQHRRMRRKLGVKSEHRIALLRNLVRCLVINKRIKTTLMKAKEASSFSESMIELAKKGDLHSRRLLISKLRCPETVDALIKEIAPQFQDRHGGYTRVLKVANRVGDGSPQAILEFTAPFETPAEKREKAKAKREKTKKKAEKTEEAEAPKKPKKKTKKAAAEEEKAKAEETPQPEEKKEGEKKGGFLGTLRKFLKGDE